MPGKVKVSVTVDATLLDRVDKIAAGRGRSFIFEQALNSWLRRRRQRTFENEIEEYYRSLGKEELAEDRGWAGLGDEATTDW